MKIHRKQIFLLFILSLSGCFLIDSEAMRLNKKNPKGTYGSDITLTNYTLIEEILSYPDKYIDKDLLVEGRISDVCPMRGCWIILEGKQTDNRIRIKVTDGKIVFPLSAVGYDARVEGKLAKLDFTEKQARSWKVHLEKEKGNVVNPDSVIVTDSDLVELRIIGKGAHIFRYGCDEE